MTARVFLAHQINALVNVYDVSLITNFNGNHTLFDCISKDVKLINLPIRREINLFYDLKATVLLTLIIKRNNYSLVHSISPKAGLITAIASWICRVPNRIHTFTGQVWVTKSGFIRKFLKFLDKVVVTLNTHILVDSHSQQDFLVKERILLRSNSIVLGKGSISGVNNSLFRPSLILKNKIRKKLQISDDIIIFLFVGRLKKEKGIFELFESFKRVSKQNNKIVLLIVGPDEERLKEELIFNYKEIKDFLRFVDFTKNPEYYFAASDIFVLPSYREGFGSVIIEAASSGLPSIGSNIYGLSDAIINGETGFLTPAKSVKFLQRAMTELANNKKLRNEMGIKARIRAISDFSHEQLTHKLLKLYKSLI